MGATSTLWGQDVLKASRHAFAPCAQVFYEGMHNDSRTNLAIALSAAEAGAAIANYVEMTEVLLRPDGVAAGVRCRDNVSGEEFNIAAKAVIFAGGRWPRCHSCNTTSASCRMLRRECKRGFCRADDVTRLYTGPHWCTLSGEFLSRMVTLRL